MSDPLGYTNYSNNQLEDYAHFSDYFFIENDFNNRFIEYLWNEHLSAYFQVAKVPMDAANWKIWFSSVVTNFKNSGLDFFDKLRSYAFFRFFFFSGEDLYDSNFMQEVNQYAQNSFGPQATNECILAVSVTGETAVSISKFLKKLSKNHFTALSRALSQDFQNQSSHLTQLQELFRAQTIENVNQQIKDSTLDRQYFSIYSSLQHLFELLTLDEMHKLSTAIQDFSQFDFLILNQMISISDTYFQFIQEEEDNSLPVYDANQIQSNNNNNSNQNVNNLPQSGFPKLQTADQSPALLSKPMGTKGSLVLSIVQQPPVNTVYKRNLRPFPQVTLHGKIDPNKRGYYHVIPLLVRCDSYLDESKYLLGAKVQEITPGRIVAFKKLKITTTSHQQGETLFCLRIELRRYLAEEDVGTERFSIEDLIYTNPITVLSHSTQLKPVPTVSPTIQEAIPNYSPTLGGTRLVIVGNNLGDGPYCRIKFDNIEVIPQSWGSGTWICHCPPHGPGQVQVRVSNDAKTWSSSSVPFLYESENELTWNDFLIPEENQ